MGGKNGKTVIDVLREGKDYEIINAKSYFNDNYHVPKQGVFNTSAIIKPNNPEVELRQILTDNGLKVTSAKDINRQMHITAQNKKGNSYVFREGIDFGIRNNTAYSTFNKAGNIVAPPKRILKAFYDNPNKTESINSYMFWEKGIHSNDSNYNNIRIKPEVESIIDRNIEANRIARTVITDVATLGIGTKVKAAGKGTKVVITKADDVVKGTTTATKGANVAAAFQLSNKNIQHITKYTFEGMPEQAKYLTDAQLNSKLKVNLFFTKNWFKEQVA